MDLRLLRYFVAVVDHGGISRAAQALYIAQPSLSQAIRKLEGEVGAELFDRSSRPLTLTAAGVTFEVGARAALREAEEARRVVTDVRDLRTGRLRVATTSLPALDPLPAAAALLRARHPGLHLHVRRPGSSAEVVTEVRQGRAELGLTHLDIDTGTLERRPLLTQRFGLVMTTDRARGLPAPFPLVTLPDVDLVADDADGAAGPVEEAIRHHGGHVLVWSAHPQATWELVRLGLGAAFLPAGVADRIPGTRLLATEPALTRPLGIVHRASLSPAAAALLAVLTEMTAGQESRGHCAAKSTNARAAGESPPST
ncbi:MAG: LysR family transcriptional regulator [Mobilicoccus sp.]|nr:LysR family transcriptional regulator [Mobilicoccus sp.]